MSIYGGYDPEKLVRHYLASVNRDDITAALAGLCGYFTDVPASRPTRAFAPCALFNAHKPARH
jgi:hypothetical protein